MALIAFGTILASPGAWAQNAAEGFVQSEIDMSYAILDDAKLDASARQQQFAAQIRSAVDTKRVALFVLGPYARQASKEDLDAFTSVFTDFLTSIYHQTLNRYKNRSIKVTGSMVRAEDDVVVNAVVPPGSGQPNELHVAFRVRMAERGYAITDFQAEGAWLSLTQRADFTSYLQQHGGNVMQLSAELQQRSERMRADLSRA